MYIQILTLITCTGCKFCSSILIFSIHLVFLAVWRLHRSTQWRYLFRLFIQFIFKSVHMSLIFCTVHISFWVSYACAVNVMQLAPQHYKLYKEVHESPCCLLLMVKTYQRKGPKTVGEAQSWIRNLKRSQITFASSQQQMAVTGDKIEPWYWQDDCFKLDPESPLGLWFDNFLWASFQMWAVLPKLSFNSKSIMFLGNHSQFMKLSTSMHVADLWTYIYGSWKNSYHMIFHDICSDI
jgi:hypothetical protein